MNGKKIILQLLVVPVALLFLAGSAGITVITHHCDNCGNHSVHAGLFIPPSEPEDDCCEAADTHCESEASHSDEMGCCHFSISKLKLANFSMKVFSFESTVADAPLPTPSLFLAYNETNDFRVLPSLHNKHGGRQTLALTCQILS